MSNKGNLYYWLLVADKLQKQGEVFLGRSDRMNAYEDSDKYKRDIYNGTIKPGSIIRLQWPSGNGEAIRYHGKAILPGKIRGCNMAWDNLASEDYNLHDALITGIIEQQ